MKNLTQVNQIAFIRTKMKITELEEFQELDSEQQFTIMVLLESGILMYLDEIAKMVTRVDEPIN